MTKNCFDIGTIQAFLDGELAPGQSEAVARHVSACDDCAILLAAAEEETAFAFSTLEQEFNTLVPTQRLWTKINDSIEREKKSFWKPIFAFLLKPSTAAFAGLLFVAVVSITLLSLKLDTAQNYTARTNGGEQKTSQPVLENQLSTVESSSNPSGIKSVPAINSANSAPNKNEFRAVKAVYATSENARTSGGSTNIKDAVRPAPRDTILGEESYLKTIATLSETVNSRKDEAMNASARFEFERDMAVTDDAIRKMRKEVKANPNDAAARQILRASYQNKIDLLNSVAEKTELMASLK